MLSITSTSVILSITSSHVHNPPKLFVFDDDGLRIKLLCLETFPSTLLVLTTCQGQFFPLPLVPHADIDLRFLTIQKYLWIYMETVLRSLD